MNQTRGAEWLHGVKNRMPRTKSWGRLERELLRRALKWEDEGMSFEDVLERVTCLRIQMGGAK